MRRWASRVAAKAERRRGRRSRGRRRRAARGRPEGGAAGHPRASGGPRGDRCSGVARVVEHGGGDRRRATVWLRRTRRGAGAQTRRQPCHASHRGGRSAGASGGDPGAGQAVPEDAGDVGRSLARLLPTGRASGVTSRRTGCRRRRPPAPRSRAKPSRCLPAAPPLLRWRPPSSARPPPAGAPGSGRSYVSGKRYPPASARPRRPPSPRRAARRPPAPRGRRRRGCVVAHAHRVESARSKREALGDRHCTRPPPAPAPQHCARRGRLGHHARTHPAVRPRSARSGRKAQAVSITPARRAASSPAPRPRRHRSGIVARPAPALLSVDAACPRGAG